MRTDSTAGSLLADVEACVRSFFDTCDELMFNEADLQHRLAVRLRDLPGVSVWLEYALPAGSVDGYDPSRAMRVDIVAERDGRYVPVELKYKSSVLERPVDRFGQGGFIGILAEMSAYNEGMYDIWADIRRLELLGRQFPAIEGGVFAMLSNSARYITDPKPTSNHYRFSVSEGTHGRDKSWLHPEMASSSKRPAFVTDREYAFHWQKVPGMLQWHRDFKYAVVTVPSLAGVDVAPLTTTASVPVKKAARLSPQQKVLDRITDPDNLNPKSQT